MNMSITEEQFGNALKLLTKFAKKKLQFSTDKKIAELIGKSENKDETIRILNEIAETAATEDEILQQLKQHFPTMP